MSENDPSLKNTPLYKKHIESGARMVPFAGWNMPVQYTGIIEEHLHTRSKAGLFDICHMGEFILKGRGVGRDINNLVTRRIDDMDIGKCRYGFMLNDKGGIIDDLIVFKISQEEYMLVVNAGTIEKDRKWIEAHVSSDTKVEDVSASLAKLDIQGPLSGKIMGSLAGKEIIDNLKRYNFVYTEIEGAKILISRTGYTGELGYELFFPAEYSEKLWDMLLKFDEAKPIGLGARGTLRLEMGYSLYGHDIDEEHNPLEANLSRFVYMDKQFIGRSALLQAQGKEITKQLIGFICEGRRSAREHYSVFKDGKEIGIVTSGGFSPCLKKGIGLCYIDKKLAEDGQEVILTDGKVNIKAILKNPPIYDNNKC